MTRLKPSAKVTAPHASPAANAGRFPWLQNDGVISKVHDAPHSRDLVATLSHCDALRSSSFEPLLEAVRETLAVEGVVVYRPIPRETHWDLDMCTWLGRDAEMRKCGLQRFARRFSPDGSYFGAYDPFAVEREQRNRLMTVEELSALDPVGRTKHERLYGALGATGEHQLRVLLCDGPRLLAWFGVVQRTRFRREQRETLASAIPLLRAHARRLAQPSLVQEHVLSALLEQMSDVAFLMTRDGRLELLSQCAADLLATNQGRAEWTDLRRAVRARQTCAGYCLTPLTRRGLPDLVLAVRSRRAELTAFAVARAARRWKLSAKAAFVLTQICEGRSNKEIAAALACAEVTVERHLTQLFRASGARSRAELATRTHQV